MYNYNKVRKMAILDGKNDALYDISIKKYKKLNSFSFLSVISKVYDYYYVKSYNSSIKNLIKNKTNKKVN